MPQPLHMLEDHLRAPDFAASIGGLGARLRADLGMPRDPDEVGVVCPDVEAAAEHLERTYEGMGPFMLGEGGPAKFWDRGERVELRARVGFGWYQDVLIELAEPGHGSDVFRTHLDPGGGIALHHLGFYARGPELRVGKGRQKREFREPLAELGYTPTWEARVALAGMVTRVTIFDTYDRADGLATEFLDFRVGSVGGPKAQVPREAMEALARLQKKHGPRVIYLPEAVAGTVKRRWDWQWSRELAAPPEAVWPLVAEPAGMQRWLDGECRLLSPGEGGAAAGVGARRRLRLNTGPGAEAVIDVVDEARPGRRLRTHAVEAPDLRELQTEIRLSPMEQGTYLEWHSSFLPRALGSGWRVHDEVDAAMERSLDRLVALLGA